MEALTVWQGNQSEYIESNGMVHMQLYLHAVYRVISAP